MRYAVTDMWFSVDAAAAAAAALVVATAESYLYIRRFHFSPPQVYHATKLVKLVVHSVQWMSAVKENEQQQQ